MTTPPFQSISKAAQQVLDPIISSSSWSSHTEYERWLLQLLALASGGVLLQSSFICWGTRASGGCKGVDAWAVACGSIGFCAVSSALLLVQLQPQLLGGRLRWCELLLLIWWSVGAATLTFSSPNCLAGNGYFGTWAAFAFCWLLATVHFKPAAGVRKFFATHTSRAVLFLSCAIEFVQALAISTSSKGSLHECTAFAVRQAVQKTEGIGRPSQDQWEIRMALSYGIVGTVLAGGHLLVKNPPIWKVAAVLCVIWWSLAVLFATFFHPFFYIGNGYLSCWAAWFASVRLLFEAFSPRLRQRLDSALQSLGAPPKEILALISFSLAATISALFALGQDGTGSQSHEGWAFGCSTFSALGALFIVFGKKRWNFADERMAQFYVFLLLLWTAGTLLSTFIRPFRMAGNGFLAAWFSLAAVAMLVKLSATLLGLQGPVDFLVRYAQTEGEMLVMALASLVLFLQACVDCQRHGNCGGHENTAIKGVHIDLAIAGAILSLFVLGIANICNRSVALQALFNFCTLLLASIWCAGVIKLTFDAPYNFVDAAYLSCWCACVASCRLLAREWKSFVDSKVQAVHSEATSVIPSAPTTKPSLPTKNKFFEGDLENGNGSFPNQPELERNVSVEKKGWHLEPVGDKNEWEKLCKLFAVTDPSNLGKGRDVKARSTYTNLKLVNAWRIQKPHWEKLYDIHKGLTEQEINRLISDSGLKFEHCATKLDDAARQLVNLDDTVNEKLLLHGTKPESALSIIHNGLNEKLSGGLFGKGVYLAEDPSKIDQYCTPDIKKGEGEDLTLKLQQALFRNGVSHAGNLHYCFAAKAILGVPIKTKDGEKNMSEPYESIYATADKRELAIIPNTNPPAHYHSLIAEAGKGNKVVRHREFIVFEGDHLMLEYIFAYQRC